MANTTVEHTPVSGRGASQLSPFCVPIVDCKDGVNRKAGTQEKRTTTFPAGSSLVGAPFTEVVETCCGVTGKPGRFVVTKQRVQLGGSATVAPPNCVPAGAFDCCTVPMTCCTDLQGIPTTLNLRFLPGVEGYRLAGSSPVGWFTQFRPSFKLHSDTGDSAVQYDTWGRCSALDGVVLQMDLLGAPADSQFYASRGDTYCMVYYDADGVPRSLDTFWTSDHPTRKRLWIGVLGDGRTYALDVVATLTPCYKVFGAIQEYWYVEFVMFLLLLRAPYGPCDIDRVVTQSRSSVTAQAGYGCNYTIANNTAPVLDASYNWNYYYHNIIYRGPGIHPSVPPIHNALNEYFVDYAQDDPCAKVRPLKFWLGLPPQVDGQDVNAVFDGGTSTCLHTPDYFSGAYLFSTVDGRYITGQTRHFFYFQADPFCQPGANVIGALCPSVYLEEPCVGLGCPFPPYVDTPDKRNQFWTFGVEIFE